LSLLKSFLEKIPDGNIARVAVPLLGQREEVRLDGFFQKKVPPNFSMIFPEDVLRTDQVDSSRTCMVTFDFNEQNITILADILASNDLRTLNLIARESVSRNQSRDFFRISGTTRVVASSPIPERLAQDGEHWRLFGTPLT